MSMNEQLEPNKMYRNPEQKLVGHLVPFLQNSGYRVRLEVPSLGQSADIVATRGRWVTAIEAKMHDWKKALEQCRVHENLADYVCIALGTRTISENLITAAQEQGYGIIHCSSEEPYCSWVLRPRVNKRLWPAQREYWIKNLRAINYED